LAPNTNLLIIIDQFEEIFRFRKEVDSDEADAFVTLALETAAQREFSVYVVITMRSDYLGDCALFAGLPEALNESQYLTPRMTREQRRAAIVGPARQQANISRLYRRPDITRLPRQSAGGRARDAWRARGREGAPAAEAQGRRRAGP